MDIKLYRSVIYLTNNIENDFCWISTKEKKLTETLFEMISNEFIKTTLYVQSN